MLSENGNIVEVLDTFYIQCYMWEFIQRRGIAT